MTIFFYFTQSKFGFKIECFGKFKAKIDLGLLFHVDYESNIDFSTNTLPVTPKLQKFWTKIMTLKISKYVLNTEGSLHPFLYFWNFSL